MAEQYPIQVVCAWIGNTPQVATKHYLQVTEDHFQKAVHNQVQYLAALARTDSQDEPGDEAKLAICGAMRKETAHCENREPQLVGDRGLEPPTLRV